jgi:hypothetical protein
MSSKGHHTRNSSLVSPAVDRLRRHVEDAGRLTGGEVANLWFFAHHSSFGKSVTPVGSDMVDETPPKCANFLGDVRGNRPARRTGRGA